MNREMTKFTLNTLTIIRIGTPPVKWIRRLMIRIIFLLTLSCAVLAICMYILKRNCFLDISLSVCYFMAFLNGLLSYLIFMRGPDTIRQLIRNIDEGIFIYMDEQQIKPHYKWISHERNMIRLAIYSGCQI